MNRPEQVEGMPGGGAPRIRATAKVAASGRRWSISGFARATTGSFAVSNQHLIQHVRKDVAKCIISTEIGVTALSALDCIGSPIS